MEKFKVFLSSTMTELHNERMSVHKALKERGIEVIWFEGFGARPETAQIACLEGVQEADVYIGIFWNQYSPATEEEYREADQLGKPRFIYIKDFAVDREEALQRLIAELGKEHTYKTFGDALTLAKQVPRDIVDWLVHQWRLGREAKGVKLPQPSIVVNTETNEWYLFKDGKGHYIPDNPTLRAIGKSLGVKGIFKLSSEEIRQIPHGNPLRSQAPQIFQDSQGVKYLVAREERRRIPNDKTLKALGGDPWRVRTKTDEYLARYREGSPLPEHLGVQWSTSEPWLVKLAAEYTAIFLVRGPICRYIPTHACHEELREKLQMIGQEDRIDEQELESYIEGVSIESTRDVRTALEDP
ncbi:MAG: DUF4062 domain-containing protein [Anaerolineae bacterium]